MATQLCFQAPSIKMEKLDNLWFQLSSIACNLKCKHCYLSCSPNNKKKNFLPLDEVKNALEIVKNQSLKGIYLTGGEPLLHPDFNNIVRLCLKKTNVTILSNGILINDKKARFLRQIESDHDNELIFRISLDHYTEEKNDEIRGKGSFKKALNGIANLVRYDFNPIISIVNIWNEDENHLKQKFAELMAQIDFEVEDVNFKIVPLIKLGEYSKLNEEYTESEIVQQSDMDEAKVELFDCASSRVVTCNGVYSCPLLVGDPRGKVGNILTDSSNKVYLETNVCYTCRQHNNRMFCNNW